MKKLPIGISTFEKIRDDDYYYVDKTKYVEQLAQEAGYFFLSRPRRFGKSLFVDTLKCAFECRRELFSGLYLEDHWDWDDTHPVINISFGRGNIRGIDELDKRIRVILNENADAYGIECVYELVADRFAELIGALYEKTKKRVIILVDEYDKPILDNIENTTLAAQIRDGLKNLYSVIKDSDQYVRFCFITGVSKFSRVSIFSGLNNLEDISLDPRVGALCGYTRQELQTVFEDQLEGVDPDQLQSWYDGYTFLGKERVYNPFDVLLFFKKKKFSNYWFESGTPGFLVKLLREKKWYLPELEGIEVNESMLSSFEIENLLPEAVLFQTGYLTIKNVSNLGPRRYYQLGFPNLEVKMSFCESLLAGYTHNVPQQTRLQNSMYQALENHDMDLMRSTLQSLFSSIPHEWYTSSNMDQYEGYYASVVYSFLASLGFDLRPEESSSHGRADLILDIGQMVYVLEFKVVEILGDGQKAIAQIREKGYHHQYLQAGRKVMLVGMDFSKKERNLVGFDYEQITAV